MSKVSKYVYLGLAIVAAASVIASTIVVTSVLIYEYLVKWI
jgi:hypothetical protein